MLEEDFDAPACLIECSYTSRCPLGIICDEDHDDLFAVNFDKHFHSAQLLGILFLALGCGQDDEVITNDFAARFAFMLKFLPDSIAHIILCPSHPKHTALMKVKEMAKVDIGLIE